MIKEIKEEMKELFFPKLPAGYMVQKNQFGVYRVLSNGTPIPYSESSCQVDAIDRAVAHAKRNVELEWEDVTLG